MMKLTGAAAGALAFGALSGTAAAADPAPQTVLETSELGGRENYSDSSRPTAGNYEPTTESELRSALSSASGGEVVFVPGDASIEVTDSDPYDTGEYLDVSADVTLASDRGVNGSTGGLIYTDQNDKQFMKAFSGARVTGIRIGGPLWEYVEHPDWGGPEWSRGVGLEGDGVEVDNCEIYGWGHYGVGADGDHHVHHCHLHHMSMNRLGYGTLSIDDLPEFSYNVYNHNRHSVAGSGGGGNGYQLHHSFFGGETISFPIDMHEPGGTQMEIYNNTVAHLYRPDDLPFADDDWDEEYVPHVVIRGTPADYCDIYNNWFYNPQPPLDSPPEGEQTTNEAIVQQEADTWANMDWWNNHYGSDEPSSDDVGAPLDGQGGDGGDGGDGGNGGDGSTHFEITTADSTGDFLYEFTVDGSSVTRDTSNGDDSAESSNDSITDNGDGTFTVSGKAGNGYGDSYFVDGEVTSWSANYDTSEYALYFDGTEIDPDELGSVHFEITTESDTGDFLYEFTVDGSVTRDTSNGDDSAESSNDSITDNGDGTYTVSGKAGNGYGDSYFVDGEVTSWWANYDTSEYALYFDGTEIDPYPLMEVHFEITTADSTGDFLYEFTVDGSSVTRDTSNGDDSAESSNDSITDNGDGTFTVSGKAGNGYGDSYFVDGEVTSWSANYDQSMYTLYYDDTEIDPATLNDD